MDDLGTRAYEAHLAAAILALGIQKINILGQDEIDRVYELALDSLYKAGINIEFHEIMQLKDLPIEEAQNLVINLKSNIIAKLQGSCGILPSGLFELTFNLYLISTTPEELPNLHEYLCQLASQIGLNDKKFSEALNSMKDEVEVGLVKYENSVNKLIKRANEVSLIDLIGMKPGIGGFNFDIKKAMEKFGEWRKG